MKKNKKQPSVIQIEQCNLLRASTKTFYDTIKSVFCPILNKNIVFNAKGYHHLSYKPDGTARIIPEIIHKLTLLPLVPVVIKNAIGIHEERDVVVMESRKKDAVKIPAKQYALVALAGKKNPINVRVIILEVQGSPEAIFWSVMRH